MDEQIRLVDDSYIDVLVASHADTQHNYFSVLVEDPVWWVPPVIFFKFFSFFLRFNVSIAVLSFKVKALVDAMLQASIEMAQLNRLPVVLFLRESVKFLDFVRASD